MATEPTQPFPIVYMLGVIILDIAIILSAMTYLADINIQQHYDLTNLKYSVRAARLMNSPSCFAYEDNYTINGETKYQVVPGVIDLKKFTDATTNGIPYECTEGEQINLELVEVGSNGVATGVVNVAGATMDSDWKRKTVTYFVIVDNAGVRTSSLLKYNMKI